MRTLLLFLNATLLLLAITSLMVFFTGDAIGQGAMAAVMILLLMLGAPFSTLGALATLVLTLRRTGWTGMKARILGNIPNWLKFGMSLSLALLFCGELALLLTHPLGAETPPLFMYLPVLTGTLAILAYALVYSLDTDRS